MAFTTATSRPWWHERGISKLVAGVFEGGGAKGVLYRGALHGMLEEDCWFGAAAGASAGAITATAIAVGLEPDAVGRETERGLEALRQPRPMNGLLRVRNGSSYLDQDSLKEWLAELLERQVQSLCGESGGSDITFGELHSLTEGFELDIVAVDLTRQHRVVFNYMLTPSCSVAAAVVASAAIPLVFESMLLTVPQQRVKGVIVDGGVLANFPSFVFKDPSYREWAGLPPLPFPVVGFLLDEQTGAGAMEPALYRESVFLPFGSGGHAGDGDRRADRAPVPSAARRAVGGRPGSGQPRAGGCGSSHGRRGSCCSTGCRRRCGGTPAASAASGPSRAARSPARWSAGSTRS